MEQEKMLKAWNFQKQKKDGFSRSIKYRYTLTRTLNTGIEDNSHIVALENGWMVRYWIWFWTYRVLSAPVGHLGGAVQSAVGKIVANTDLALTLGWALCAKLFIWTSSLTFHITACAHYHHPHFTEEKTGLQRSTNSSKVTELVNGGTQILAKIVWL